MILLKHKKRFLVMLLFTVLKTALILAQSTIRVPGDATAIQAGIDAAQSGDTVMVSPGIYNENINFKGKAITVTSGATSFAGATSTIINGIGDGAVVTFDTGETASAALNGFTVEGGHTDAANCFYGGGIYIDGASPTITNNAVMNNISYGLYIANQASPLIQGNDINGTRFSTVNTTGCHTFSGVSGAGTGIELVYAGSPQIIGNIIENNVLQTVDTGNSPSEGAGISINFTQQVLLKSNIIRNNIANYDVAIGGTEFNQVEQNLTMVQNLIYGNVGSNSFPDQVFFSGTYQSPTMPTLTEINNTIYGGGQEMILSFAPSKIENNIFVTPAGSIDYGLECADPESQASPFTIENNDNFAPGAPSTYACNLGSGNISVDPGFLNPASFDLHEQPASPTVATGDINAPDIPAADLDNKARTVCGTIDMGAYELHPHPPITLTSSANPQQGGAPLTFTAQLTGNCNVPIGTVTFYDGSTAIGTGTINSSGVATFTTSFLVVGQHNITASYPGDFNFEDSTSPILVQTIIGDPTATSLTVSPNPASAFSPVILSSVVTSPYVTPNGTVVFMAGAVALATATLDASGHASATISSLGGGTYTITANYQATTLLHASSSPPVFETVTALNSATSLSASPNPALVTQTVTITAAVQDAQGSIVPTGTVTLMDGTANLGTATLNASGIATFTVSTLSFGAHTITANYAGSANFNPSSAGLTEQVNLIATWLTLTASPNPANGGQTVTIAATATSVLANMVPVGTVTFYDGGTILTTATLGNNATATYSMSSLAIGTHPLTAVLASNSYFGGTTSPVVNEVVQAYDFTLSPSSATLTIPSGDYSNITITVSPVGGFAGSVSLSCEGVPDHTQCIFPQGDSASLSNGAKTVTLSINTSDVYGYGNQVSRSGRLPIGGSGGAPLAALLLPALGLLGLAGRKRDIPRCLHMTCLGIGVVTGMLCLQSCSGKLPGKTAPGTYAVSVVGVSASGPSLQHSIPVQLIVTP